MKKTIRMNERELHRLISESVKRTLNENLEAFHRDNDAFRDGLKALNTLETLEYPLKGLIRLFIDMGYPNPAKMIYEILPDFEKIHQVYNVVYKFNGQRGGIGLAYNE